MDSTHQFLINAARQGDLGALRELIAGGADVNVQDEKGYTPLIIACYNGQLEAARLLLDSGADVDAQDFGGNTALMGVCFKGYPDIAELLIQRGASLDMQHGNGGTALMFATMFGRNELVKVVLKHGANKDITETRGLTALDLAIQQGNEEAAMLLRLSRVGHDGVVRARLTLAGGAEASFVLETVRASGGASRFERADAARVAFEPRPLTTFCMRPGSLTGDAATGFGSPARERAWAGPSSSGSRPVVGSSMTNSRGSPISACAIPSLRFIPPESLFAILSRASSRPT